MKAETWDSICFGFVGKERKKRLKWESLRWNIFIEVEIKR